MPVDTIDSIKRRMIRNASRLWGYTDTQDINSFDPVLGLIIGALAEELHNISREINNADERVMNKLLDLLFAQNIFSHFPAHAIAFAHPNQPRVSINGLYQFYYTKEIQEDDTRGKPLKKNIYFSPVAGCKLFAGEVKYLLAGNYLYEIDGRLKEIIAETSQKIPGGNTKLFIGIKMNPLVDLLDGLSLFFSFKNFRSDDRFFHALHSANWKINGRKVNFFRGMDNLHQDESHLLSDVMKKESDISDKSARFITEFYSKMFMTLENREYRQKDFLQDNHEIALLKELFGEKETGIFENDVLWLEIDFSQPVTFDEINDLIISINSFPVVNRELNEYTHSVSKGTNVIPLLTNDLFFDVRRVTDSKNEVFSPRTSLTATNEGERTYFIRQGGVARFDSRDAKQTIQHLIDLVRDEAAAFSGKGTDLISYELKQLNQILARLEQRVGNSEGGNDLNSYMILESNSEYDKIQVQFWSITGSYANNIRPGSRLFVYDGIDIDEKKVVLLTQTFGGRHKLSKEDKLNKLRRSLLSKGRIVTKEDIKALCFELYGENLKTVDIKKGISAHETNGSGLSRTIDIYLIFKEGHQLQPEEIWQKNENLKVHLKQESVNLLPYRVFSK